MGSEAPAPTEGPRTLLQLVAARTLDKPGTIAFSLKGQAAGDTQLAHPYLQDCQCFPTNFETTAGPLVHGFIQRHFVIMFKML